MEIFNGFANAEDVFERFNVKEDEQKDVEFIYAFYNQECYEGSAFVLFARKGKLYEVNGSHCSCYGLEDQWSPEETFVEALFKRDIYYVKSEDVYEAIKRWKRRVYARKRRAGK